MSRNPGCGTQDTAGITGQGRLVMYIIVDVNTINSPIGARGGKEMLYGGSRIRVAFYRMKIGPLLAEILPESIGNLIDLTSRGAPYGGWRPYWRIYGVIFCC